MKRFKKAYIEITNNCNLNCSFCPKTTREKKFMNVKEYEHIVEEIKPFVNFIYLHLMGEPLMHPNIKEILEISKENNLKINITTNGTLIEKNKALLLEDLCSTCVRKVSFSVHSFESNNEKEYIDNELKEYLNNILDFSTKFAEKEKTIVLKLWNVDSTNIEVCDKKGKNILNDLILRYIYSFFEKFSFNESGENKFENIIEDEFKIFKEKLIASGNLKIKEHIYIQLVEKFELPIQKRKEI